MTIKALILWVKAFKLSTKGKSVPSIRTVIQQSMLTRGLNSYSVLSLFFFKMLSTFSLIENEHYVKINQKTHFVM